MAEIFSHNKITASIDVENLYPGKLFALSYDYQVIIKYVNVSGSRTGTIFLKSLSARSDRGHCHIDPGCAVKLPVAYRNRLKKVNFY